MPIMFSGRGLRRRVALAVERTLEPGEVIRSTVYLHVYGDAIGSILTGLPTGIRTWIVALTDRRVILLKGNELNAAKSELVAAFPLADVAVAPGDGESNVIPKHLEFQFAGQGNVRFAVPLIWRRDAGNFITELG
jgi:hypothetical protein